MMYNVEFERDGMSLIITLFVKSETGLYHYGLQIVPSKKKKNGKLKFSDLNSYAVSERNIKVPP